MRTIRTTFLVVSIIGTIHCASTSESAVDPPKASSVTPTNPGPTPPGFGASETDAGMPENCVAPDMIIALDRTLTMTRRPDGVVPPNTKAGRKQTRFGQAIEAIHQVTGTASLDTTVRLGLELWPKTEETCVGVADFLDGTAPTNASCEGGETVVSPELGMGATIASKLDVETTKVCRSTPTGTALLDAKTTLDGVKQAGKKQYVVLVTDGADWDHSCPDPNPVDVVDQLAAAGVETLIISFTAEKKDGGGAVSDRSFLNDVACAGHTAKGFPDSCEKQGDVYRAKADESRVLFFPATNTESLVEGLSTFAQTVCCGCVK